MAGREKLRATGGYHAWQLLMLDATVPVSELPAVCASLPAAHNKCQCFTQVESNLLTLFLCGQLFLSCVLLLLLLLVTCCLLLLVLQTLGAASATRSLELTLYDLKGCNGDIRPGCDFYPVYVLECVLAEV